MASTTVNVRWQPIKPIIWDNRQDSMAASTTVNLRRQPIKPIIWDNCQYTMADGSMQPIKPIIWDNRQDSMASSTTVNLSNQTDKLVIVRYSYKDFYGSDAAKSPLLIEESKQGGFKHIGDASHNSVGGVAYTIEGKIKWIFAWNNKENERNKVVTVIVDFDNIDWRYILRELEGPDSTYVDNSDAYGYRSSVQIDKNGSTPKLNATLSTSN